MLGLIMFCVFEILFGRRLSVSDEDYVLFRMILR